MSELAIDKIKHVAAVPVGTFFFQSYGASTTDIISSTNTDFEADPQCVNGVRIVPWGATNNLPNEMRNMMESNHLAPGILNREQGLLWGQGPKLYKEVLDDNKFIRAWEQNSEVESFLNDIDYEKLILANITEYKNLKGFFTKIRRNKAGRIGGKNFITEVEFEPSSDCRLGWVDSKRVDDVKNIYVGDWNNFFQYTGVKKYPVFDKRDPFKYGASMNYTNLYSFGRTLYSMSEFWGSKDWIQRSSDIPKVLKALTDNSMAPTYIVKVPAEYWDSKEEALKKKCELDGTQYKPSMLDQLQKETFKKVEEVLGGIKNVGKFFSTVSFTDHTGNRVSWEIEPIELKVDKFIESQLKIGERADTNTIGGISLSPNLANSPHDGKALSSGSENLYAYKIYLASDTNIPETFILKLINDIIKINFPKSKVKLGFYHDVTTTQREEDTTPKNRLANQEQ